MAFPLAFCFLKNLHYATRDYSSNFFSRPIRAIQDWTIDVYNSSPLIGAVWPYVPHPVASPLLSAENLKFAVLVSIFACGVLMRDSGGHLSRRISAVRQRAEEKRWERSLTGDLPRPDVLTVQIDLTTKDQWYKRPFGIVLLAVIGGAILLLFGRLLNLSE
jgi:hypothetical protein